MGATPVKMVVTFGRVSNQPSDFWICQIQREGEQDGDNPCGTGKTVPEALRALADDLDCMAVLRFDVDKILPFSTADLDNLR